MADQEKWELSREEIEARLREQNQEQKAKGLTRGGRSSGQGWRTPEQMDGRSGVRK